MNSSENNFSIDSAKQTLSRDPDAYKFSSSVRFKFSRLFYIYKLGESMIESTEKKGKGEKGCV